ncbi:Maf-domain-containing protein [Byssothecium circinans]|uniref:Maf-domain-containing protein n=1 Tax=Byssothecium circinans TaxID=147558 RepID=A0A6A5TRH5_9PLEO|nr:Maf-domain-containing protein [Byssothecium circinans]
MASQTPSDPPPSYEEARSRIPPPVNTHNRALSESQRSPRRPPPQQPLDTPALNELRGKRVILASASPRRKQLLALLGLTNVEIIPSNFSENLSHTIAPYEYVLQTAQQKALDVYKREIDNGELGLVIAADTIIISHRGIIMEKPRNPQHHLEMLKKLRDEGSHQVATAVVVMRPLVNPVDPGYRMEVHTESTTVKFDPNLTDERLTAYIKTRDGNDKAGGYGLQSAGSILIERIEGSHDNVIGLPLRATLEIIEKCMEPEENMDDHMDNMFSDELI